MMALGDRTRSLGFGWHVAAASALVGALALHGCGAGERASRSAGVATRGNASIGGQVVSTVDGRPITVAEIERLVRAGLTPQQALRRLQSEQLLMEEAERRGLAGNPAVHEVKAQAEVQAVIEQEANAVTVSDADVRRAYEQQKERFERPERRAAVHVLAKLPPNSSPQALAAAKEFADRMVGELALAPDPVAFVHALPKPAGLPFQVVAEQIPAVPRHGRLVEPFLAAMFSISAPGVVPQPVQTSFGWHAIRVTQILPAETTPYDKAADVLHAELLLSHRRTRLHALLDRLRKEQGVQVSSSVGQRLAHLEL